MKESVLIFLNDYHDLVKLNLAFYKNHWKGMIVTTVVIAGAEIAVLEVVANREKIKTKIKNVTKRKPKNIKIRA